MATLYTLKPAFQNLLRPLVRRLAAAGVTANQVTTAAAAMSIVAGGLAAVFAERPLIFLILPGVLFVRMALNAIDGMLAREHGQASTAGMYLNELCDVVSDLALILPFAALPIFPAWGVAAFAITAVIVELAGVLGIPAGIGRNYAGPFGKSDRALALGLLAVLVSAGFAVGTVGPYVFPALALLSLLSAANRVRAGLGSSA